MNIFFLHRHPHLCARYHCDKHVVKMIVESTQLLYTAHMDTTSAPNGGYKKTHMNHPCAKWVRETLQNYRWLVRLAKELVKQYRWRYGAEKTHACEAHLARLAEHEPAVPDTGEMTLPRMAMPDEFKQSDPVLAYREYYRKAKTHILQYRKGARPHFLR
jgi:hypothetical protein